MLQAQLHQQLRPLERWRAGGQVLERDLQKRRRLGVRRRRDGLGGRGSGMGQGAYAVARGQRVVGQCGRVPWLEAFERVEQSLVQARCSAGRDRALHGLTSELVTKRDAFLGPGQEGGLVEPAQERQVDTDERQHAVIEPVRGARDELEDLEVVDLDLRDARQHRVPHRGRQGPVRLERHLRDVEGVPTGELVDAGRVQAGALDRLGHRLHREGLQRQRAQPVQGGEVAQELPGRVSRPDLEVAIAEQDRERHRLDASGEVAQHVRRRCVRPVQVLDHQHRRLRAQLGESGLGRLHQPRLLGGDECREPRQPELPERPQRTRCPQRVALAAYDA